MLCNIPHSVPAFYHINRDSRHCLDFLHVKGLLLYLADDHPLFTLKHQHIQADHGFHFDFIAVDHGGGQLLQICLQEKGAVLSDSVCLYHMGKWQHAVNGIEWHLIISCDVKYFQEYHAFRLDSIFHYLCLFHFDSALAVADLQDFSLAFLQLDPVRNTALGIISHQQAFQAFLFSL